MEQWNSQAKRNVFRSRACIKKIYNSSQTYLRAIKKIYAHHFKHVSFKKLCVHQQF